MVLVVHLIFFKLLHICPIMCSVHFSFHTDYFSPHARSKNTQTTYSYILVYILRTVQKVTVKKWVGFARLINNCAMRSLKGREQ